MLMKPSGLTVGFFILAVLAILIGQGAQVSPVLLYLIPIMLAIGGAFLYGALILQPVAVMAFVAFIAWGLLH